MNKPFTTAAIVLLSLIAVMQLVRALSGWEVVVNGAQIPLWASWFMAVVAGGLAAMAWREGRR
jgi:predicted tellurium resistance membrane protein TerC